MKTTWKYYNGNWHMASVSNFEWKKPILDELISDIQDYLKMPLITQSLSSGLVAGGKKAWRTRRAQQKERSERAKKAWRTRRAQER